MLKTYEKYHSSMIKIFHEKEIERERIKREGQINLKRGWCSNYVQEH